MKKICYVLLALSLLCFSTACGSKENSSMGSSASTANIPAQASREPDVSSSAQESNESVPDISLPEEQNPESESDRKDQPAGNILIVYFSRWGNTDISVCQDTCRSSGIHIIRIVRVAPSRKIDN